MPAPLAVDWHEVKTLVLAIGIEAAAEQTGLNVNSIKARSAREEWFAERKAILTAPAKARAELVQHARATGAKVIPTAAEVLSETGSRTRAKLASVAERAATKLSTLDEDELVDPSVAEVASKYTGIASKVHGWDQRSQDSQSGTVINIALMGLPADMAIAEPRMALERVEG